MPIFHSCFILKFSTNVTFLTTKFIVDYSTFASCIVPTTHVVVTFLKARS